MSSTPDSRKSFVARLERACDECPYIPPKGQGRGNVLSERLGVAPEAVSKWFKGVSKPREDKMRELAQLLGVDCVWLAMGEEPEVSRRELGVRKKTAGGAIHLVWGHITLDGGHCSNLPESDSRRDYVDFQAVFQGTAYPIYVSLGREVAVGQFELIVPAQFAEVRVIGVLPAGPGKYHFIEMPGPMIDKVKLRKGGLYAVTVTRAGTRYTTESAHWPRINSFAELT